MFNVRDPYGIVVMSTNDSESLDDFIKRCLSNSVIIRESKFGDFILWDRDIYAMGIFRGNSDSVRFIKTY